MAEIQPTFDCKVYFAGHQFPEQYCSRPSSPRAGTSSANIANLVKNMLNSGGIDVFIGYCFFLAHLLYTDRLLVTHNTPWLKTPPFHMPSFYNCRPISILFGTPCTELICHAIVVALPTSPTFCCHTTLGNINCHIGQDSAPAYCVHQKINLLQRETPKLIPPDFRPPNSSHLNPVDCRI